MTKTIQTLKLAAQIAAAAADLVDRGWAQRALARDRRGRSVASCDPDACAWCLTGALEAACEGDASDPCWPVLLDSIARHTHVAWALETQVDVRTGLRTAATKLAAWNDSPERTAADVADALRGASAELAAR